MKSFLLATTLALAAASAAEEIQPAVPHDKTIFWEPRKPSIGDTKEYCCDFEEFFEPWKTGSLKDTGCPVNMRRPWMWCEMGVTEFCWRAPEETMRSHESCTYVRPEFRGIDNSKRDEGNDGEVEDAEGGRQFLVPLVCGKMLAERQLTTPRQKWGYAWDYAADWFVPTYNEETGRDFKARSAEEALNPFAEGSLCYQWLERRGPKTVKHAKTAPGPEDRNARAERRASIALKPHHSYKSDPHPKIIVPGPPSSVSKQEKRASTVLEKPAIRVGYPAQQNAEDEPQDLAVAHQIEPRRIPVYHATAQSGLDDNKQALSRPTIPSTGIDIPEDLTDGKPQPILARGIGNEDIDGADNYDQPKVLMSASLPVTLGTGPVMPPPLNGVQ